MKKILLLFSIVGICSSLLAQAPQVTNVIASQIDGTKDVSINFDISAKEGVTDLNIEVWFKESPDLSQWSQVEALFNEAGDLPLDANGNEDPVSYEWTTYSHKISGLGPNPVNMTITWRAGDDAPDINTPDAQIRIVAFYTKLDEADATPLDASGQVSGWDGFDDGSTGGDTGGDTGAGGDGGVNDGIPVYDLTSEQVTFLTAAAFSDGGFYTIEAIFDEDPNSANYGATSSGNVYVVHQPTPGEWVKEDANYVGLDVANVPSKFALEDYLSNEALNPAGHIASGESSF